MTDAPSVTLETKCWERDWEEILRTDRLRTLAERNAYAFAERVLMINNVEDPVRVARFADKAVADGRLTRYVLVRDHAEAALDFFGLTAQSLGRGYVYSIAELVSLFLCRTGYLLHFAGDCMPREQCEWVQESLRLFAADPRIRVANLSWDIPGCPPENTPAGEAIETLGDFYVGYGFSDQCYLVRTADFRARIYGEANPESERYPGYGGELFEKRVDAWMRNHGHMRATYAYRVYDHAFPDASMALRLRRWFRTRTTP